MGIGEICRRLKIGRVRSPGHFIVSALLVIVAASYACADGERSRTAGERSKREADSALGLSGLPGATGIGRAITAADSAAVRAARLDSLAKEP